jgi:hypothetical protein
MLKSKVFGFGEFVSLHNCANTHINNEFMIRGADKLCHSVNNDVMSR